MGCKKFPSGSSYLPKLHYNPEGLDLPHLNLAPDNDSLLNTPTDFKLANAPSIHLDIGRPALLMPPYNRLDVATNGFCHCSYLVK